MFAYSTSLIAMAVWRYRVFPERLYIGHLERNEAVADLVIFETSAGMCIGGFDLGYPSDHGALRGSKRIDISVLPTRVRRCYNDLTNDTDSSGLITAAGWPLYVLEWNEWIDRRSSMIEYLKFALRGRLNWFGLVGNTAIVYCVFGFVYIISNRMKHMFLDSDGRCGVCGYILRVPGCERCPECGARVSIRMAEERSRTPISVG